MRLHRFSRHYARMSLIIDMFAAAAAVLASFTLAIIRYGAGHTWHSLRSLGVTAYRKIADLRPVYRESYDTHGLSLVPDRMRC
jgi:hypothetical protein